MKIEKKRGKNQLRKKMIPSWKNGKASNDINFLTTKKIIDL